MYEQLELFSASELCTCSCATTVQLLSSGAYDLAIRSMDLVDYVHTNLRLFKFARV